VVGESRGIRSSQMMTDDQTMFVVGFAFFIGFGFLNKHIRKKENTDAKPTDNGWNWQTFITSDVILSWQRYNFEHKERPICWRCYNDQHADCSSSNHVWSSSKAGNFTMDCNDDINDCQCMDAVCTEIRSQSASKPH
jgi:hypothetical protein